MVSVGAPDRYTKTGTAIHTIADLVLVDRRPQRRRPQSGRCGISTLKNSGLRCRSVPRPGGAVSLCGRAPSLAPAPPGDSCLSNLQPKLKISKSSVLLKSSRGEQAPRVGAKKNPGQATGLPGFFPGRHAGSRRPQASRKLVERLTA